MSFSQPSAGGDQFDAKNHNGQLLIVFPKSFSAETPTAHGISPSADVDIVVVDDIDPTTGMPRIYVNARLFGNLAKSVSRDLGGQVLGRLGQVPTQRGNPAWVLQNYTDQDVALATPALNAYQAGQFKQPDAPAAPTTPAAAPAAPQYPAQGAPAAPQQQQWQAQQQFPQGPAQAAPQQAPQPPFGGQAPAAAPAQQWQAPAPTGQPATPAAAPAPAGGAADPALLAHLAQYGINLPPTTPQAQAEAVAATLPQ
jgi:hypothetical protein